MILAVLGLWAASAGYIVKQQIQIPTSVADLIAAELEVKVPVGALAFLSVVLLVLVLNTYIFSADPLGRTQALMNSFSTQEQRRPIKVDNMIDEYNNLHDDSKAGLDARNSSYATLVNAYYGTKTQHFPSSLTAT